MVAFLRSSDAFIWSIGTDARFRSTIVTLILLDSTPDFASVADRFEAISRMAPMFRKRVVPSPWPAPPRWEPDPEFDLAFHLRRVGAPRSGGDLDGGVLELARLAAMADFDAAHPLWEQRSSREWPVGGSGPALPDEPCADRRCRGGGGDRSAAVRRPGAGAAAADTEAT